MEKELKYLHEELDNPAKPFVVIMGGAKVSDKIGVLKALIKRAEKILIGGAMANTFFKAQGIPVGDSRVEADKTDLATELLDLAKERGVKFLLRFDNIDRQEKFHAALLRKIEKFGRQVCFVRFNAAVTDRNSLGFEKRIRHRAADQD